MEEHPEARFIVDTLNSAGFIAYYAGGWVRDALLELPSDDIDIATNAPPETIQALFPHTVPIGIAFGIILVIYNQKQYEVATFRKDFSYKDGRRPTEIAFTTAVEDAMRRDFTINGMFYDPIRKEILDYVGGREDLERKCIRAIGNPHLRIQEDRLRMIRGVRLSCRFQFQIDPATTKAICSHSKELFPSVAIERVVQELIKAKAFLLSFLTSLFSFGLLQEIFPSLEKMGPDEIEQLLAPITSYPKEAPLIAFLLPLFPDFSLEDQLRICKYLRLSTPDAQFVRFLFHAQTLFSAEENKTRDVELAEWAHLYANPLFPLALQIHQSHLSHPTPFSNRHNLRKEELQSAIDRIATRSPLITSTDLKEEGILPGKTMGALLKEAERAAINQQLDEKRTLLRYLKHSSLWPKSP